MFSRVGSMLAITVPMALSCLLLAGANAFDMFVAAVLVTPVLVPFIGGVVFEPAPVVGGSSDSEGLPLERPMRMTRDGADRRNP